MVTATNNDQVFQTTGNKEFTVQHKAKIASAQEWPFIAISQVCTEGVFALLGAPPVALSHAGTSNPDFAHASRRTEQARLRVHNLHTLIRMAGPDADQRTSILALVALSHRHRLILLKLLTLERLYSWED